VIGAGPVGLSAAFWAGMREASSRIIDSLPELGGQLTTLYPEKWIFDVPGHPKILAKDLVELHRQQTVEQFDVPVHLETTGRPRSPGRTTSSSCTPTAATLRSRTVIVAGGHGAFEPKKLPDYDMTAWEGRGAHYPRGLQSEFEGKRVVIIGGGDSACDWVVNLLDTAERVSLVHRREGFRAHEATVKEVMDAHADGAVDLHDALPGARRGRNGTRGAGAALPLRGSRQRGSTCRATPSCSSLGFKTALGPLKEWGFEIEKGAIRVDGLFNTSLDRVWACGDITTFDGKAQADRHRLRRWAAIAVLAGRPPHPARDEDPAEVLDEHGRPGRRRGPGIDTWEHLSAADPVLARLLDERGVPEPDPDRLAATSTRARARDRRSAALCALGAPRIYGRLLERFGGHPPTPEQILAEPAR